MKIKCLLYSLAILLALLPQARSALVLTEYFSYGASNVAGNSALTPMNGDPWNSAATTAPTYLGSGTANANASFAGSGYALTASNTTTGSMQVSASDGNTRGTQRAIGSSLSGEVWVSMMVRMNSGGDAANEQISMAFNSVGFYQSSNPNGVGFGIGSNDGTNWRTATISSNGTTVTSVASDTITASTLSSGFSLMVARLNVASGNDAIDIWTFANNAAVPTTVTGLGVATLAASGSDFWGNTISNVYLTTRGLSGTIDAIRISNSTGNTGLNEVLTTVPEPATWALLAGSLTALMVFRRRRRSS